jgi:Recombinase
VKKAGATTLQQIADALNDRGVATARGGSWYPSNVRNVPARDRALIQGVAGVGMGPISRIAENKKAPTI